MSRALHVPDRRRAGRRRSIARTSSRGTRSARAPSIRPTPAAAWPGTPETLDGTVSCSVVIDPDVVRRTFEPPLARRAGRPDAGRRVLGHRIHARLAGAHRASRIWSSTSCTSARSASARPARATSGRLAFLDHLVDLGVNAVELLPMAEFCGNVGWGYGDSHHFCIESSAGGRDKYRHFVRECHRRGIAVHPGRRLQPLRSGRRARAVAVRFDRARTEHLLLVRGTAVRLPVSGRRLSGQRLDRLHAALLGRGRAPAVHQQRRVPARGDARRWASRRFDAGDPPRQRAARRRRSGRQRQHLRPEAAARVEPHAAHDPARRRC